MDETNVSVISSSEAGIVLMAGIKPVAVVSTPKGGRVMLFPAAAQDVLSRFHAARAEADLMLGRKA